MKDILENCLINQAFNQLNNKKMYFTANIKENKLPYQEPSMKNIVERYQK